MTSLSDHELSLHTLILSVASAKEISPAHCEAAWTLLGTCTCKMNSIRLVLTIHYNYNKGTKTYKCIQYKKVLFNRTHLIPPEIQTMVRVDRRHAKAHRMSHVFWCGQCL